jgi:hypothetical protein
MLHQTCIFVHASDGSAVLLLEQRKGLFAKCAQWFGLCTTAASLEWLVGWLVG